MCVFVAYSNKSGREKEIGNPNYIWLVVILRRRTKMPLFTNKLFISKLYQIFIQKFNFYFIGGRVCRPALAVVVAVIGSGP